jgi:hypothetical protein
MVEGADDWRAEIHGMNAIRSLPDGEEEPD